MKRSLVWLLGLLVITAITIAIGFGCGSSGGGATTTTASGPTTTTTTVSGPTTTTTTAAGPTTTTTTIKQTLEGTISYGGTLEAITVLAMPSDLSPTPLGAVMVPVSGGQAVYTVEASSSVAGATYYLAAMDSGLVLPKAGGYGGAYGVAGTASREAALLKYIITTEAYLMTIEAGTLTGLNFNMHLLY